MTTATALTLDARLSFTESGEALIVTGDDALLLAGDPFADGGETLNVLADALGLDREGDGVAHVRLTIERA